MPGCQAIPHILATRHVYHIATAIVVFAFNTFCIDCPGSEVLPSLKAKVLLVHKSQAKIYTFRVWKSVREPCHNRNAV